jgi:NADH dehydrogenase FAD-containing subunit
MAIRRILILGGGFDGIYTAIRLEKMLDRRDDVEITLITRDNFFLFTPMLHEIAACDLELSNTINPLRKMLRRVSTFIGTIESIDLVRKTVCTSHGLDDQACAGCNENHGSKTTMPSLASVCPSLAGSGRQSAPARV